MSTNDTQRHSRFGRWAARAASCVAAAALMLSAKAAFAESKAPKEDEKRDEKKAKDDTTAHMGGEHRVVNGHSFITPSLAFSAMTNGSFSFRQGGGILTFEGSDLQGKPKQASLFLYGQQFLAQIGIMNRVAIDITAGGTAAVGGDTDTLVILGALALLNVGAMPRVRVLTLDKIGLQITAGVGVYYDRFLQVSPGNALSDVLETGKIDNIGRKLLTQSEALSVVPALMIAEGVGPFGAQVSIAPRIGVAGDGKSTSLDTAVHLNFDLRRVSPVPFAITAEYQALYEFGGGGLTHTVVPGVFYSGRRDFNIGMVALINPPKGGQAQIQAQLGIQYFF